MEISSFFLAIKIPMTLIHVLSVVVGMGAALASDILFNFFSKDRKLTSTEIKTLSILSKVVLIGLVFIIISGLFIFLSDIPKYSASVKFLTKMSIMPFLLINGFVLHKYIWPHLKNKGFLTAKKEKTVRRASFACGAISVVSWVSLLMLGSLNNVSVSYNFLIILYLCLCFVGILTALVIEQVTFES